MFLGGQFIQQTFAECDTIPVRLIGLNGSTGIPPYYMFAYAPEGTTIVSHIGDKPDSLNWQVQHPKGARFPVITLRGSIHNLCSPGSKLLLTIVDGNSSTGGFSSSYYDVVGT